VKITLFEFLLEYKHFTSGFILCRYSLAVLIHIFSTPVVSLYKSVEHCVITRGQQIIAIVKTSSPNAGAGLVLYFITKHSVYFLNFLKIILIYNYKIISLIHQIFN